MKAGNHDATVTSQRAGSAMKLTAPTVAIAVKHLFTIDSSEYAIRTARSLGGMAPCPQYRVNRGQTPSPDPGPFDPFRACLAVGWGDPLEPGWLETPVTAHDPHYNGDTTDPGGDAGGLSPAELDLALATHYTRLQGLVRAQMARLTGRNLDQFTESPTAHTNDLCMDLVNQRQPFRDAEHMLAVASIRCRQILVDYLRKRGRAKRGGGNRGAPLTADIPDGRDGIESWLLRDGIEEALTRYVEEFPKQSQVLTLRVFFGRSIEETADLLGISTSTVEKAMRAARAYLRAVMEDGDRPSDERAAEPN